MSKPLTVRDALRHLRNVAADRERHIATHKTSDSVTLLAHVLFKAENTLRQASPFVGYEADVPGIIERVDAIIGVLASDSKEAS